MNIITSLGNPNNSFEVVLIDFKDLDNINILGKGKELIKKCIKKYKDSYE